MNKIILCEVWSASYIRFNDHKRQANKSSVRFQIRGKEHAEITRSTRKKACAYGHMHVVNQTIAVTFQTHNTYNI